MATTVRYRVLKPCFIDDRRLTPEPGRDIFVHARPGLDGTALELAPEEGARPKGHPPAARPAAARTADRET